jgi:hypothetical protein
MGISSSVLIWKPVIGFEDFYMVKNAGDVLSLRNMKLRKPVRNPVNGYYTVVLSGDHVKRTMCIHRIVAEAFVDNPNKYGFINHKDENKLNNNACNLEWCTKAYNNTYNGKTQRCCKSIVQIDPKTGDEVVWSSARKAHEAGIAHYKNISACCRGLRKTAGGYEWRFNE